MYVCICHFSPLFNFFRVPLKSWLVHLEVRVPQVGNHCLMGMMKNVHGTQTMQIGFPAHKLVRTGGKHHTTANDVRLLVT
jgi:hypothetical protein